MANTTKKMAQSNSLGTDFSLSPLPENKTTKKKSEKKPKLGRYESLMNKLLNEEDPYKKYIAISEKTSKKTVINFIDLFSGAGGITQGLKKAGFNPVASVEISEIASATHIRNFPSCKHFCGDITTYKPYEYIEDQKINLVVGGPPCQGFSVAGKRDPNDPRNRMFREFVRIVNDLQPEYFVMENVPGILTIQGGKVKEAILEAFEEIGYPNVSVAILEAADYGVPQIRTRAIFIGNRLGLPNPFPAPQLTPENYTPIETAIGDLINKEPIPEFNHEWTKHSKQFEARIAKVKPGESLYETFYDAYKRQYKGVPSMTIKENHGGTHIHPTLNRCISAREMARLQSFPDDFIFEGTMKKAMWQIGNAVPPRLAECIGYALAPFIEAAINDSEITGINEVNLKPSPAQLSIWENGKVMPNVKTSLN
jgi:DNA (cytosine-5)-methyltransferase 1